MNGVRVDQAASGEYAVHQFRNFVGGLTSMRVEWVGQSTQSAIVSPVYLQILNLNSGLWETIDFDDTTVEDTNITLSANVSILTDYADASNVVTCRVYQLSV